MCDDDLQRHRIRHPAASREEIERAAEAELGARLASNALPERYDTMWGKPRPRYPAVSASGGHALRGILPRACWCSTSHRPPRRDTGRAVAELDSQAGRTPHHRASLSTVRSADRIWCCGERNITRRNAQQLMASGGGRALPRLQSGAKADPAIQIELDKGDTSHERTTSRGNTWSRHGTEGAPRARTQSPSLADRQSISLR